MSLAADPALLWLNVRSKDGVMSPDCPQVVGLASGPVGHLLCWERHDRDGSWQAWVSWVQESGSRPVHGLVCVPAESLTQLESPVAYREVPRGSGHGALLVEIAGQRLLAGRGRVR
jgi:hypothetical protein